VAIVCGLVDALKRTSGSADSLVGYIGRDLDSCTVGANLIFVLISSSGSNYLRSFMKSYIGYLAVIAILFCTFLDAAAQESRESKKSTKDSDLATHLLDSILIQAGFTATDRKEPQQTSKPALGGDGVVATPATVASVGGLSAEDEAFRASMQQLLAVAGDGFRPLRGSRWGSRGDENIYNTEFVIPGSVHNRIYGTKKGVEGSFVCSFHSTMGSPVGAIYTRLCRQVKLVLPEFSFSDAWVEFGETNPTTRFLSYTRPNVVITIGYQVDERDLVVALSVGSPEEGRAKELAAQMQQGLLITGKIITDKNEVLPVSSRYTGQGTFNWSTTKQSYTGSWVNGEPDGKGRFTFGQGHYYEGQVKQGEINGHGVFYKPGSQYTGEFLDGKYHGYGELYSYNTKTTVKGKFAAGRPVPGATTTYDENTATSSTPKLSPEQQRVIDEYNANMDLNARRRKEESEALDRRIEADRRRINSDYRTQYNNAQQRSHEQTQQNIDKRNRELEKQDKDFDKKYNR
jgi:hypothetical protein